MKNLKRILATLSLVSCLYTSFGQTKTIHVFVALCDNVNQGIVPVPKSLGNGQEPKSNLYWGAAFGLKSYFRYKTKDWTFVKTIVSKDSNILERVVFKHVAQEAYIVADAYDGAKIKACIDDFLKASNGQNPQTIVLEDSSLTFGGKSDLVAYIGHDGLMEFSVNNEYRALRNGQKDAMILACYSKAFFKTELKKAQARPLLWTTHLMAPEAYTLKAAIDGWLVDETGLQIEERAAQAYHKYQKCGLKGARNLFTSGY